MNTHHAWLSRWSLKQDLAILMSVVMLVSSFTMSVASAGQPSAAQITEPLRKSYQELGAAMAGSSRGSKITPEQVHDRLKELFQSLEVAERELSRDTFDIQVIIQKVGRDPVKLYEWVRDETFLVPYRGTLRGDKGVLMDRLGNSLDRSLLLHTLLRSVGQEVRLAHGSLSKEQAMDLMQKARPVPKGRVPLDLSSSRKETDELVEKYAKQHQLDRAELLKQIDKLTLEQQRMVEEVTKRVVEQARVIAAAVGKPSEKDVVIAQAGQIDIFRDHWWVQWKKESTWVDLDTALPDAKPGKALANAQETIAPDKLPASLHHEVQIRIVIEQWQGNKLKEVPVLTHNLKPSELLGEHITLRHIPLKWPKELDLFQEKEPLQRLKTTVLAQEEWLPVLSIGDRNIMQSSFTASGDTNDKPGAPILGGGAQELGRGVGDILGRGRIGGAPGLKPKKDSDLTAEWIDYEIRSPGQPVSKIRRQIFDFVGPAARSSKKVPASSITEAQRLDRGLILLGETEMLPLASQLSSQFVKYLMTKNMLTNQRVVLSLLDNENPPDSKALNDQLSKLNPLSTQLYNLALARREWSRVRGDVYLDRPNILSYHKNLHVGPKGEVLQGEAFDIVANDVAVRPGSKTDPFLIRLEQGVVDTNAEALLIAENCEKREGRSDCGPVENTAEIFAQASNDGAQWLTIHNRHDSAWHAVALPQDMRAQIEQDLEAGYVVLIPQKVVHLKKDRVFIGWWRVNLQTGQLLGMDERGWGSAPSEKTLIVAMQVIGGVFTVVRGYLCAISAAERRGTRCIDAHGTEVQDRQPFGEIAACMLGGISGGGGALAAVFWGPSAVAAGIVLLGGTILLVLAGYQLFTPTERAARPCWP